MVILLECYHIVKMTLPKQKMETNTNEIVGKLKENVILKLVELDPSRKPDSTLIDYILVMVVNQKSKFAMKHDLSLFLGKIVDEFVNWLFDFLAQLKMNVSETNDEENENKQENIAKLPELKEECLPETKSDAENKESINNPIIVTENESQPKKTITKRKLKSAISITSNNELNERVGREKVENDKTRKRSNVDDESSYAVKRHMAIKDETIKNKELHSSKNENEMINSIPHMEREVIDTVKENETKTKFLVTLNGVKDMFKDNDNLFLLDEDFDPELMTEDLSSIKQNSASKDEPSIKENQNSNKNIERCKYWPNCLNGPSCEFFHPTTKCNNFPYCRFGDKCLYIHPTCKFDSFCSRNDCPFFHSVKPRGPPPIINTAPVICKYYPNCKKPSCEFFHPKNCHYGIGCKSVNCPFVHPPNQNMNINMNIPHPSKMKWSSSKNANNVENNNSTLPISNKKEIEIK